jgi:hypothetical protein
MERELGKFEAAVAHAVHHTVKSSALPGGEEFDRLIDFIALLSVRTPAAFEDFVAMINLSAKEAIRGNFPDEAAYIRELTRIHGGRPPTDHELSSFREFIERGKYRLVPKNNNDWVQFIAMATQRATKSLSERHWSIVTAVGADFVCSDHPVVLCFNGPSPYPDGFRPGLRTPETWLVAPLSKRCALIGTLDSKNLRGPLPVEGVAWLNRKVIERSRRYLIHSTDEICWLNQGVVATKHDLIEARRWTAPPS